MFYTKIDYALSYKRSLDIRIPISPSGALIFTYLSRCQFRVKPHRAKQPIPTFDVFEPREHSFWNWHMIGFFSFVPKTRPVVRLPHVVELF